MSGTPIRCDTHVVVWLFNGEVHKLTRAAKALLDDGAIVISPIVELELTWLYEIGRTTSPGSAVTADLQNRVGLQLSEQPLSAVVSAAADLTWTRDPFDRLIAADASAAACQLLTKDRTIRSHFDLAVW